MLFYIVILQISMFNMFVPFFTFRLINIPQAASIWMGSHRLNSEKGSNFKVTEIIHHPAYDFIYDADVALLRLQKRVVFTDNVRPLCLPRLTEKTETMSLCYIAGWGVTEMKSMYEIDTF